MPRQLDRLRQSTPDLARLDPLSTEVRVWLDEAYAAVRRVDAAEGVILKLHEHSLRDPRFKAVASAEIIQTIDRAWLDEAYAAVRRVDAAEGVILKLHEHSLRDPRFKAVASAEIVQTIDRARATHELMHRTGLAS